MNKKVVLIIKVITVIVLISVICGLILLSHNNYNLAKIFLNAGLWPLYIIFFGLIFYIPFDLKEQKKIKAEKEAEQEDMKQRIARLETEIKKLKALKHS